MSARKIERMRITGNIITASVGAGIRIGGTYSWKDALIALGDAVDAHDVKTYGEILGDIRDYIEELHAELDSLYEQRVPR